MTARARGLWPSLLALFVVAFALLARPLVRGEGLGGWTVVGAGPPWSQTAPRANTLADADPVLLELPEALLVHRTGARWDPRRGLGEPTGFASWPTLTHPLAWPLYRALPPVLATVLLTFVHVLSGGVLCLLWLRWRGAGAAAALAGAIAFELSPLFTAWLARPWITGAMPLGVLALWSADALGRRPGPRAAGALALAVGGLLLCALPQLGVLLALAAFGLVGAGAAAGARLRALGWAGAALAVGAVIALPRELPLAAFMAASNREAFPWADWHERTAALRPSHLATLLVPDAWGHPMRGLSLERRSPYDNFQELRLYLGLPVLVLAVAGATRAGARRFALGAVLAMLLAASTPLAFALWAVPGFAGSSATRSLWLLPFLAPPLVAAGAARLWRGERGPAKVAVVAFAATLLLCEWLAARDPLLYAPLGPGPVQAGAPPGVHLPPDAVWPAERWLLSPTLGPLLLALATAAAAVAAARGGAPARRLAAGLLVGLAAGELLREGHVYLSTSPASAYYPETPATRAVSQAVGRDRVLVRRPLPPSLLAALDVRAVGSYGPLHSDRLVKLLRSLDPGAVPVRQLVWPGDLPPAWRDALSVRALLGPPAGPPPGGEVALVHDGPDARVWSNPGALPRARLHPPAAVVEARDLTGALAATTDPGFDPRVHVVVETGRAGAPPAAAPGAPTPVDLLVDEPERVVLRVDAPAGGVLVLADAFAPGWTCATGDGAPLAVLPASVALRGVELPPGFRGEVVFSYSPPGLRAGLALGLLGLALAVAATRRR